MNPLVVFLEQDCTVQLAVRSCMSSSVRGSLLQDWLSAAQHETFLSIKYLKLYGMVLNACMFGVSIKIKNWNDHNFKEYRNIYYHH